MKKNICILLSTVIIMCSMPVSVLASNNVVSKKLKNQKIYVTMNKEDNANMSDREKAAVQKFNQLYNGAESQLTGHTTGNKNLGKSKEYMMEVATVCMPYIGYPRTLNALSVINNVYDAK